MSKVLTFIVLLVCLPLPGWSQVPLFESHHPITIKLEADLRTLLKDRGEDREEHPATLTYIDSSGSSVKLDLQIRVRGNFRSQAKHCDFPPLRFNFKKKQVDGTPFAGQDKLKMVNPCQRGLGEYKSYVILEYVAYRVYNHLTEYSFKVRQVEITYEDTTGKEATFTTFGFLIEDEEAMANRLNSTLREDENLHQEALANNQITLLSLFQFMIGNTDWSVPGPHNLKLIKLPDQFAPYPIPYDFDFSGLVNPPYATPQLGLPIKRVTDRYYLGYCRSEEQLTPLIERFQSNKNAIYEVMNNEVPLSRGYRKGAERFLDEFYATIDRPNRIRRAFIKQCRQ